MVKSKARSHFVQYMKDKPVKWGFKFWVIADPSGYTVDFNLYTGKSADSSELSSTTTGECVVGKTIPNSSFDNSFVQTCRTSGANKSHHKLF